MKFIDQKIEDYCLSLSSLPDSYCEELEQYTRQHVDYSQMLIGKMEASFLGFLIRMKKMQYVLEIGTFTGYSALAMASHLPADGKIYTLDINPQTTELAQSFWQKSPHGYKIHSLLGDATKSLQLLHNNLPEYLQGKKFDLIFIDADKTNYLSYLKQALPLLGEDGIMVLDNCLWSGKVLDPTINDEETVALREVSHYIHQAEDLYATLLPIRDGIFLLQKK